MKKIFFGVLILIVFLPFSAYGFDDGLLNIRNKIFNESLMIKPLIATSSDPALLGSMWDSSLIIMTNIDAYFFMLGIFETIKDKDLTEESVDYLITWLKRVKTANNLNIRGLNDIAKITDERINEHIKTLKDYFAITDITLDAEIGKADAIKRSLKIKKR